jgi:hypothetical protein
MAAMRMFPVMFVAAMATIMIAAIGVGRHGGEHCGG